VQAILTRYRRLPVGVKHVDELHGNIVIDFQKMPFAKITEG
jgi:hypothetical protein